MQDTLTTRLFLPVLSETPERISSATTTNQQAMTIPLAETIAELRFQENVYQSALEISRRTIAVLSMFKMTF